MIPCIQIGKPSNYLIARIGKAQGASMTLSFDEKALKSKDLFSRPG